MLVRCPNKTCRAATNTLFVLLHVYLTTFILAVAGGWGILFNSATGFETKINNKRRQFKLFTRVLYKLTD